MWCSIVVVSGLKAPEMSIIDQLRSLQITVSSRLPLVQTQSAGTAFTRTLRFSLYLDSASARLSLLGLAAGELLSACSTVATAVWLPVRLGSLRVVRCAALAAGCFAGSDAVVPGNEAPAVHGHIPMLAMLAAAACDISSVHMHHQYMHHQYLVDALCDGCRQHSSSSTLGNAQRPSMTHAHHIVLDKGCIGIRSWVGTVLHL